MDSFQELRIQGEYFSREALLNRAREVLDSLSAPAWQISIWSFIFLWLDEEKTVTVKTSGTTGISRTRTVNKEAMVQSARKTGAALDLRPGDKACLCLPVDYIAGKMMIVRAFVLGLDLYIVPPDQMPLKDFQQLPVIDFIALVPVQLRSILETKQESVRQFFNSIRNVIIGGAMLDNDLSDKCQKYMNRIFATYGMTETLTHIALQRINGDRPEREFVALPDVFLSTDEENCLIIHAPWLSPDPIQTHDVVELVSDTHFRWLGRSDFVINSGGIKIHPEQVEQELSSIISNRSYFITGVPDSRWGEMVTLVLEGELLSKQDESHLQETIAKTISSSHRPRQIIYRSRFQRTASGKIKRRISLSASES